MRVVKAAEDINTDYIRLDELAANCTLSTGQIIPGHETLTRIDHNTHAQGNISILSGALPGESPLHPSRTPQPMSDDKHALDSECNKLSSVVKIDGTTNKNEYSKDGQPKKITITSLVGPFGWWQFNIASFYFIAYILTTFNNLGISFHAAKTDSVCVEWINRTDSDNCVDCLQWSFNNSINFDQTIISEFKLNCGQEWLSSFSQSIYQLGYVFSGIFIGYVSDSQGRYRALCIALLFELLGGVILIVSNSIYVYTIGRFILGFGDSGRGLCLYMLTLETVGKRYRTDVVLTTSFGWVVGYLLLPAVAYLLHNFRYLQMVPTVLMGLMFVLWLPHIPESPRWLLTTKRTKQAHDLLRKACHQNGRSLEDFEKKFELLQLNQQEADETARLNAKVNEEDKKSNIWDLFRSRQYRAITLILWCSFYINGFIYHGFNLNVDILGGDIYLNFALAGLSEIPSTVLNLVGMRYSGRKTFTIGTILSAALCYSVIVLGQLWWSSDHWSIVLFSMLGKMFIFSTYNAIYIHAGEIFPTELRHSGVSSCSIAARFGSTVAPFVKELAASFGLTITMIIFGSMSFITAFLTLFLPETKDKELVDRI